MTRGGIPNLGRGEVPTQEDIDMANKAQRVNLAIQFMVHMLGCLPSVAEEAVMKSDIEGGADIHYTSSRNMNPAEVFEYSMELARHVELYMHTEPESKIFS